MLRVKKHCKPVPEDRTHLLATLVDGVHNPVDAGIAANSLVRWVDHNDLKVLVGGVLSDPVRVEDAEVAACAACAHLSEGLARLLPLELVDTMALGLAVRLTLGDGALAATAAHTHAVDHIACSAGDDMSFVPIVPSRRRHC